MATHSGDTLPCRLTVPNDLRYLAVVRQFVSGAAAVAGFDDDDQGRLALAADEAATNAIEYAFGPDEEATFDVTCRPVPAGIEVRVHDMGMPYDPTLSRDFHPDRDLEHQEGGGLGRFLMRQLADEFHYRNLGAEGKEIRLVKYLDSPSVVGESPAPADDATAEDNARDAAAHGEPAQSVEFEVRRMKPEEAIEVARCVYDSYGYSYAGEHIYHPRRVAALNASGEVISAVAVTPDGVVAGHNALVFHDFLPPELAVAATKREFRGHGIATKLCSFLIAEAQTMGVRALHAKQVTVHPYTQRFCGKQGYRDCGFLLGHSPKSMTFRGISDDAAQRNSDVIGCLHLDVPEPVVVYPPERHALMVERLLRELEIPAEIGAPLPTLDADTTASGRTALHVSVSKARAVAEVRVPRCGADAVQALHAEVHHLRRDDIRVIEMYLDLTDPATAVVATALEDIDFMFTGVMPATTTGPALILQLLNGVQIEYDELAVVSDTATDLLDYIKVGDPFAESLEAEP